MKPLVSICIPTYNAAKYIEEMLISIESQSYDNIEVIIGDNASTDNSEEVINNFIKDSNIKLSYYKNIENLGYSGNCNKLIDLAKGEFVAIYHSDDIYHKDIVKKQVELLLKEKTLAGCFTMFTVIDTQGIEKRVSNHSLKHSRSIIKYDYTCYLKMLLENFCNPFFCPSSMIRKEKYTEVSGYNERVKTIEDQDMWIRLLKFSDLAIINKKMVRYRVHPEQGSSIYTDTTRENVSPLVSHLTSHLKLKFGEEHYVKNYEKKIDRLHAIDNIRLAFCVAKSDDDHQNYETYSEFMNKSKENYLLTISDKTFLKYFVLQRMPVRFSYAFLSKVIKVIFYLSSLKK